MAAVPGRVFSFSTHIRKVLRDEYADEFERGQVEVEQIYVQLCLSLVAKMPEHGLDLSRLKTAEATASEAQEKLTEAIELNKTRESNLKKWLSEARNVRTISAPFFFRVGSCCGYGYSYSCCIHLCRRPSRTDIGVILPVSFLWFAP